mgnify:CR=1 FL=1
MGGVVPSAGLPSGCRVASASSCEESLILKRARRVAAHSRVASLRAWCGVVGIVSRVKCGELWRKHAVPLRALPSPDATTPKPAP